MRSSELDTGEDRTIPFAEFVRKHTPSLFATAYLLTGQRDRAEDLLQETLTVLYPQWARVQAADRPVAYVRCCITNRFVGNGRAAVSREIPTWELPEELDGTDIADRVAAGHTVWSVLGRLGERQRAALILRYFHEFTDLEIAEAIGCRRGTARSLISRGLVTLRQLLDAPASDRTDLGAQR